MDGMSRHGPLGDLIEEVRHLNDWSQQQVADRANKALGERVLSKQNVSRLTTEYPLTSITRAAVRALAAGLNVSPDRVALAALQSMGFRPPAADLTPAEAIARDSSLSVDTKSALLAILRATTSKGA
jgi:transcriptional regulator with XRE-family HTH domain